MAKATKLGDLLIGIQLQTKALEQGLNEVKKQLNKHGNDVRKTGADYEKLAIVAGVAFYKISDAITKGIDAYNQFNNAMVGLKSVVQGTGGDFQQAQKFIDEYIKDGLVPAGDAATALKNLFRRGFGFEEATDIMIRFKDSAAYGRQGALTMGEAIRGATEGLKDERSVMVDNAGVTKNVAQMWKEYAETIGKTADSLTLAEKRQAEYIGIMEETKIQIGDAVKYSRELAGTQAQSAAATLKLKQAFGQSLAPIFRELYGITIPLTQSITQFIQENEKLVGVSTMAAAGALLLITTFSSLRAAALLLKPAIAGLKLALAGLIAHPVALALIALAAVIGVIVVKNNQAKRATEEYNTALAEHNRLVKEGASDAQIVGEQEKIDRLKELKKQYDEATAKHKEYQAATSNMPASSRQEILRYNAQNKAELRAYAEDIAKLRAEMKSYGATEETITRIIEEKEAALRKAQQASLEDLNTSARDIAQKRVDLIVTENLIRTYKNAAKGSSEWNEAQQKLADQFPQFSTASGILIDAIAAVTKAENDNVTEEWKNLQDKVKITSSEIKLELEKKNAKLSALEASRDAMIEDEEMSRAFLNRLTRITQEIAAQRALIDGDKSALDALNALANSTATDIAGIKPIDFTKFTSSYENRAMESALKVMEHKKRMDQLTLEDEVATLNAILQKHARTADEKMSIEERLYEVKKAMLERDKKANEDYFDSLDKMIQDRTDASFNWIDNKKAYDELSGEDEIAAYERMKKYHREYLAEALRDTKLSKEQKDKIYASEMATVQDLERRIFEVKRSYVDQAVNDYINRKRRQYEWEEQQERDALNKRLAALDKEYAAKERELNAEDREDELDYLLGEEKKYLNAATDEGKSRLKQIQNEIKRLNRDAEREALAEEKANRKEAIEEEISESAKKYETLKNNLETSQTEMIAAATQFAKDSNDLLMGTTNTFAESLLGLFRTFDANNDSMMRSGLDKLRSFVNEYTKLLKEVQLNPASLLGGGNLQIAPAAGGPAGNNYIVNDYGAKIINSRDEAVDYTQELFDTAANLSRGG